MRKIHTDKIRATFYIDKRLYQLLKRCSEIEQIPMSSIIENDILEERLGKYSYDSLKEWEDYEKHVLPEESEEKENKEYWNYYTNSPEGKLDSAKHLISKQLKEGVIKEERANNLIRQAEGKYQEDMEAQIKEEEEKRKKMEERWRKAIQKFPLE